MCEDVNKYILKIYHYLRAIQPEKMVVYLEESISCFFYHYSEMSLPNFASDIFINPYLTLYPLLIIYPPSGLPEPQPISSILPLDGVSDKNAPSKIARGNFFPYLIPFTSMFFININGGI